MKPQRIMVTRNRSEWWDRTSDLVRINSLPGRLVQLRARVLAVDPFTTSPNVVVGVATDAQSLPVYLRPGECLTFDREVYQVYVSNPLLLQYGLGLPAAVPAAGMWLGQVGLLAGDVTDLVAWRARSNRTRPGPVASLIAAFPVSTVTPSLPPGVDAGPASGNFPVNGLEYVRARLLVRDAAGALIDPPADLAGVLRIFTERRVCTDGAAPPVLNTARLVGNVETESGGPSENGITVWSGDGGSDVAVSQWQTVADYLVGVGATRARLQIVGLAGTGVTDLYAIIEGG